MDIMETIRPYEVTDCGLSPEQKAELPLSLQICLVLTAEPYLQETLYYGSELTDTLALKLGLDVSNQEKGDAALLKAAVLETRHDSLISFEPSELEEPLEDDVDDSKTTVIHVVQVTVTPIGLEQLAQKIAITKSL